MKDYLPDGPFNPGDEPIGDKRWWFTELYARDGQSWGGPEPDQFSPHSGTEEAEINRALLEGKLIPRNDCEKRYLEFMGGTHPVASRPKRIVTCKRCRAEWIATGYPAGRTQITALRIDGVRWLFPAICNYCDDYLSAKPMKSKQAKPVRDPSESKLEFPD